MEANTEFHRRIVVLSGRPTLLRVVDGIGVRLGPILALTREVESVLPGTHPHCHILDAMRARDAAGAREWMTRDIAVSFRRIRTGLAALAASASLDAAAGLVHSDA